MSGSMGEWNNCADQAIFHEGLDCFFGEASYVNLLLNFTLYAYSLAPTLTWICPRGVELQTSCADSNRICAFSGYYMYKIQFIIDCKYTHKPTDPIALSTCHPMWTVTRILWHWTVSTAIAMTHIVYDLDSRQSKNCRGWGVIPDESSLAKEKY